jgi:hypothetical protein
MAGETHMTTVSPVQSKEIAFYYPGPMGGTMADRAYFIIPYGLGGAWNGKMGHGP